MSVITRRIGRINVETHNREQHTITIRSRVEIMGRNQSAQFYYLDCYLDIDGKHIQIPFTRGYIHPLILKGVTSKIEDMVGDHRREWERLNNVSKRESAPLPSIKPSPQPEKKKYINTSRFIVPYVPFNVKDKRDKGAIIRTYRPTTPSLAKRLHSS